MEAFGALWFTYKNANVQVGIAAVYVYQATIFTAALSIDQRSALFSQRLASEPSFLAKVPQLDTLDFL